MKVKVKILEKTRTIELKNSATVIDLLKELGYSTEAFVVKRDNNVILDSEKLKDDDKIELIKIISGG